MNIKLVVAASLAASLIACQANPVSGRKQLVLVSEDQAQACLGAGLHADALRSAEAKASSAPMRR
jgi:hypothetical protein